MYSGIFNRHFNAVKSSPKTRPFIYWVIWMVIGTLFYAYDLEISVGKAFFMSVNVGYSIGWGYPAENTTESLIFSSVYVMVGASAVAAALGYFAQAMIASSKDWVASALDAENHTKAVGFQRVAAWAKMNEGTLNIIAIWIIWILVLIIFSLATIEWPFAQALYFAISSLSTGGLWGMPSDSPDWYYGFVGFFAATGVPLMAMAMGGLAAMVISVGDPDEAEKTLRQKVTHEELKMMVKYDLDDGDGEISRAEFILLCGVRLGVLSPELIGSINKRFKELDEDDSGALTYAEILEEPESTEVQQALTSSHPKARRSSAIAGRRRKSRPTASGDHPSGDDNFEMGHQSQSHPLMNRNPITKSAATSREDRSQGDEEYGTAL